ncbi:MAG: hypothetical protein KKH93_05725 [Candidatus Omnitrophica bacterium]|nr:hypothetical protein [Candidatus Omnitrophota bacterium]
MKKRKELLMSQKSDLEKLKNELVSIIEHKVRTPLAVIKEAVSLVAEEVPGKLNPKQKKLLTITKNNIDRLVTSIEEILTNPWDKLG